MHEKREKVQTEVGVQNKQAIVDYMHYLKEQAGFSVWQKGFYDHVVRGEQDYRDIWNYIEGNPGKWAEDTLYTL